MIGIFQKKKNQTLFDRLISEHSNALYRYALWMTGKHDVASDVVQEAFFQAWQSINSLKDESKALPWLLTILRRTVYREQKYGYRQAETAAQLSVIYENSEAPSSCHLMEIYSALEKISIKHRDVFLLHHLHGFKYDEISEHLNIPRGTVMSRLSRARQALQDILESDTETNVIKLSPLLKEQLKDG